MTADATVRPLSAPDDRHWMRQAIALAERGWGRVHPNPVVGAVVVQGDAVVGEGGPTALEHLLHQLTSGEKIGPDVTGHGRGAVTPLATGRGSIPTGKPPESTTSLARVRAESRGSYVEGDTGATEVGELSRGWRPSARKSGSQPREAPAVGGEAETTIVIDV